MKTPPFVLNRPHVVRIKSPPYRFPYWALIPVAIVSFALGALTVWLFL